MKQLKASRILAGAIALALALAPSARAASDVFTVNGQAIVSSAPGGYLPAVAAYPVALSPVSSTAAESSHVLKSSAGLLYGLSVTIGATSGYVMVFNATSLPSNGSVTPAYCWYVSSNGTAGTLGAAFQNPASFSTGVVAGFSTTGCTTLTASATAFFTGEVR